MITDLSFITAQQFKVFFDMTSGVTGAMEFPTGRDTFSSIENFTLLVDFGLAITGNDANSSFRSGIGKDTLNAGWA